MECKFLHHSKYVTAKHMYMTIFLTFLKIHPCVTVFSVQVMA